MSSVDDVLFGRPDGPAVVDVTDRAIAQARSVLRAPAGGPSARHAGVGVPVQGGAAGQLGGVDTAGFDAGFDAAGFDVAGFDGGDLSGGIDDPPLLIELDGPWTAAGASDGGGGGSGRAGARPRRSARGRHRVLLAALLAADAGGLVTGWAACALAPAPRWHPVERLGSALVVLLLALPAWWLAVAASGGYPVLRRAAGPPRVTRLVEGAVRFAAPALVLTVLVRPSAARGLALALPVALAAAAGLRLLASALTRAVVGDARQRVLVVGSAAGTAAVVERLARHRTSPRIVGRCSWERIGGPPTPVPVDGYGVGTADVVRRRITAVARAACADAVLVADAAALPADALRRLAWSLEGTGLGLLVATGLSDVAPQRLRVHLAADLPLLAVDEPAFAGAPRLVKEAVDRVGAAVLLVLLAPLMLLVAAGVALADPGPALFRQERVGRYGQRFTMYKFRSMRVDAERWRPVLERLNDHLAAGHGRTLFKMRRDPRVTTVGRLLRRSSLDELPQLLNVLRGEMSLVGPRPPLPAEVECYETEALRRLRVKPGLTGLWQVSGRADLDWPEAVRLDLSYVENWSVGLDARILARTLLAVVSGRGAR